ncbi:uncharacterized protein VTP21DRAFT_8095 [Calcarisporiella thermophila]|uniref:uncharacterized protein n=1 Tax=Calcarisporiella thermophila TaxID=911321 RepID=UPI0037434BC1
MSHLQSFVDHVVSIITCDGRVLVGTLKGFDQITNIILDKCHERVYSPEGTEILPLGLYLIRGDNVSVVGELDETKDGEIDHASIKGEPLLPIKI